MADSQQEHGWWEAVGAEPYVLDANIRAVRYRWHGPPRFDPFTVDFQAVEGKPSRRFYPVEVLRALVRGEPPDDFVIRACEWGLRPLAMLDTSVGCLDHGVVPSAEGYQTQVEQGVANYRLMLALFRHRREGHISVTRDFHRWDDFTDTTHSRRRPDCVVPGVNLPRWRPDTRPTAADVISAIHRQFAPAPVGPASHHPDSLLELRVTGIRTPLDNLLVHGIGRDSRDPDSFSFDQIIETVAPAVLNGVQVAEDSTYVAENRDEYRHFIRRLAAKHLRDPKGFDAWLRQERQKGFVRLLPGVKDLGPADRKAASERGKRFYRRLQWAAHEAMGRCYGAVALHLWVSFCDAPTVVPSAHERMAFRWYNAPLACLAGLPLWFFGRNVWQFVLSPFIELVWAARPDREFDALTRLAGVYGRSAEERRKVDANKKRNARPAPASGSRIPRGVVSVASGSPDGSGFSVEAVCGPQLPPDEPTSFPLLPRPPRCGGCGGHLRPVGEPDSRTTGASTEAEQWVLVDTECKRCGREGTYRTPMTG